MNATEDLGFLLQQAARHYRTRFAARLRPFGLTAQQAAVLLALASQPGMQLSPSAVSERVGIDAATTSGLLQRLERDGWLVSSAHPVDGRSRLVSLTPRAQAIVPQLAQTAEEVSATALETLTPLELETLRDLLRRVVDRDTISAGD